jgi:hypothetical protein
MTPFSNMPAFFGRATAVLGEHASLHQTLDRLHEWCREGQKLPGTPALQRLLQEFVSRLESHFAAEEDAGYFGTLRDAFPVSKDTIERLCAEHASFLVVARNLQDGLQESPPPPEFTLALSMLLDALAAHERAESILLRQYFTESD